MKIGEHDQSGGRGPTPVFAVLVMSFLSARLLALDLDPMAVGNWPGFVRGSASDIAVGGDRAYVVTTAGLQVIDISNPTNPTWVSAYRNTLYPKSVAVSGNYAYVTDYSAGLQIIDIRDPASPRFVASYGEGGCGVNVEAVAVAGNYAYLAQSCSGCGYPDGFDADVLPDDQPPVCGLHVIDVSDPANPRRVGFHYSPRGVNGVAVSSNYVYLIAEDAYHYGYPGFQIIELSDSANPIAVGSYYGIQEPRNITLSGNNVCVSGGGRYSWSPAPYTTVYDISNPTNAQPASPANSWVCAPAVSGNYAFTTDGEGFQVIDISNSASPQWMGSCNISGSASDVVVSGNYAYVADGVAGLRVLDISNTRNPHHVGSYITPRPATGVVVSQNLAFVTQLPLQVGSDTVGGGVQIVDISNPANPQPLGRYDLPWVKSVGVSGNHLCVINIVTLDLIDISNPRDPQRVGRYNNLGYAEAMAVSGNYAYVLERPGRNGGGGFHIIDIGGPANPSRIGGYDINAGDSFNYIVLADSYAYLMTYVGLTVLDISDPANPQRVVPDLNVTSTDRVLIGLGARPLDISNPHNPQFIDHYLGHQAQRMFVNGNYGYLADGFHGLQIIDFSTFANPQRLAPWSTGYYYAYDVAISGNYAYVAGDAAGLDVIDVSNPAHAQWVGRCHTGDYAVKLAVVGDHAYVASEFAGLAVVNISNPANPQLLTNYYTTNDDYIFDVTDVVVAGSYAYLVYNLLDFYLNPVAGGMEVIDVANPANPQRVGTYENWEWGGHVGRVAVAGNYAYVAASWAGLNVLDVRNPADPQLAGTYYGGAVADVVIARNHAYVTERSYTYAQGYQGGLRVIDVTTPTNLQLTGSYDIAGGAWCVAISGNVAYVGGNGLHVVDISNPGNPRRLSGNPNLYSGGITLASGKVFAAALSQGLIILHEYQPVRFDQIARQDNGAMRLRIAGPPGVPGRVQRSVDLRTWTDWLPVSFGESPLELSDSDALTQNLGFYRIAIP